MNKYEAFNKWWEIFWHKENKGVDFYMATKLAFLAGYLFCKKEKLTDK